MAFIDKRKAIDCLVNKLNQSPEYTAYECGLDDAISYLENDIPTEDADKIIPKDVFDRHINAEISYKQQFIDSGTVPQQMFTRGIIHGLKFAQIVAENNCCSGLIGDKDG